MFDRRIVTVWSAPNYCYRCGNVASLLELNEDLQQEYKGELWYTTETRLGLRLIASSIRGSTARCKDDTPKETVVPGILLMIGIDMAQDGDVTRGSSDLDCICKIASVDRNMQV